MRIWKLFSEVDKYENLIPVKKLTVDQRHAFDGRKLKPSWKPLAVKRMGSPGKLELSDSPGFTIPVFSEKAMKVLRPLISDSIEELELLFKEKEYVGVNVITVLDVIDYEKSVYKMFSDGNRIMYFEKYVFSETEELKKHHIFKIKDESVNKPFVSDEFKKVVEENGLTGFRFQLVWDSEVVDADTVSAVAKTETTMPREETEEDSFSYIGDLEDDVMLEIGLTIFKGAKIIGINVDDDGKKVAEKVYASVEKILKRGKCPKQFEDMDDAACTLGCLFGYALVTGYGWKWKAVGTSEEDAMYCVVSPDEALVNPCMVYIQRILHGENIGSDGTNDNTIMLLWNLAEKSMKNPPEKKLTIFW